MKSNVIKITSIILMIIIACTVFSACNDPVPEESGAESGAVSGTAAESGTASEPVSEAVSEPVSEPVSETPVPTDAPILESVEWSEVDKAPFFNCIVLLPAGMDFSDVYLFATEEDAQDPNKFKGIQTGQDGYDVFYEETFDNGVRRCRFSGHLYFPEAFELQEDAGFVIGVTAWDKANSIESRMSNLIRVFKKLVKYSRAVD